MQEILYHGASEHYVCPGDGHNALLFAATLESPECVNALISRGWSPMRTAGNGNTAMMLAWHADIVDALFLSCPELINKARESDGATPLMCMANRDRRAALVRALQLGADVNARDNRGASAAFYASSLAILDYLDDAGVDLSVLDNEGMSALHYAAVHGAYKVSATLIWDYKLDIFRRNVVTNMSPLDYAVKYGHHEICRVILESCPASMRHDLLLQYASYDTSQQLRHLPVHVAIESDSSRSLHHLLRWHAPEQLAACVENSPHGHTAVHLAVHSAPSYSSVFSVLSHYGADFNATNGGGCSPMYIACRLSMRETVQRLISLGAGVNGSTVRVPLLGAMDAMEEDVEIVQMLLSAGADITYTPSGTGNRTVLHLAALYNKPQALQTLLPHSPRELLDAVSDSGTALHCAVQGGSMECMELLLAAGADHRIPDRHGMVPYESATEMYALDVVDGFEWSIQGVMAARLGELEVDHDAHVDAALEISDDY